jgi:hypothetical protein
MNAVGIGDFTFVKFNFSLILVYLVFYASAYLLYKARKDVSSYLFKTLVYYPLFFVLLAFPSFGLAALAYLFEK